MKLRAIAFAVPLVLGAACAHGSSQSAGASTGAASADGQGQSQGGQVAGTEQPQQPSSTGAQAPGSAGAGTSSSPSSSDAQAAGRAAQDPIMHPGPPVKAHAEDQVVRGVISDVSEDTVSIESDLGVTRTLTIVPQTTIRVNGEDASYDNLSEGQPVRAAFSDVEGEDVAVEIPRRRARRSVRAGDAARRGQQPALAGAERIDRLGFPVGERHGHGHARLVAPALEQAPARAGACARHPITRDCIRVPRGW